MAKALFEEATEAEKQLLNEHLQKNPVLQQQYDLLLQLFISKAPTASLTTETTDQEATEVFEIFRKALELEMPDEEEANPQPGRGIKRYFYWAAAAAIIILGTAVWWFFPTEPTRSSNTDKAILAAEKGVRKQIVLPDSTKVWLNAGSVLYAVTNFEGTTREVRLEGEAFFDVKTLPERPFIVHANDIEIKVLGTAFNVKAYKEDENTETTLYRGLINVSKNNDANFQPIMLYPNQKLVIPRQDVSLSTRSEKTSTTTSSSLKSSIAILQIDSAKIEEKRIETAWMHNRLEFRDDDFETLAAKLERWYNVQISFTDERAKQLNFNGSFEKENIEQALKALATANPFTYKIKNDEIFISSIQ